MPTVSAHREEYHTGFRGLWRRLRRSVLRRPRPVIAAKKAPANPPIEEPEEFIEPRGATVRMPRAPLTASQIIRQVSEGLSQVPPLPNVVRELLVELQDANSTAQSVARIAASDPALAACLIRTVNSAAFGVRRKITSAAEAVSYLGYSIVRSLVVRMRLELILPRRGAENGYDAEDLWIHSLAVSYAADCLAERVPGVDRGFIATLGLLHDIGKLVINSQFPDSAATLRRGDDGHYGESFLDRERRLLGADHAEIGAILAGHWKLPDDLIQTIRWHHDPDRAPATMAPPVRQAMLIVHLANQLTKYCYVYGEDVQIDIVPDEILREVGLAPPITRLLNDRMRNAISRAIFFADQSSTRPLTAVRRFVRLYGDSEGREAIKVAAVTTDRRMKWADDRIEAAFSDECSRIDVGGRRGMRIGPTLTNKARHVRLCAVASTTGIKNLIDSAIEHQDSLQIDEQSLLPARFLVRWLLPNLVNIGRPVDEVEVAQWRQGDRLLIAIRTPILNFTRRFGEGADRGSARRVVERELGNILNLRWFSEIRTTPDGETLLFIGHLSRR